MTEQVAIRIRPRSPFGLQTVATYPELPKKAEQEAIYLAALELVARIDADLTRGVRHYRTKAGHLLVTLDQVILALIDRELLEPEEVAA